MGAVRELHAASLTEAVRPNVLGRDPGVRFCGPREPGQLRQAPQRQTAPERRGRSFLPTLGRENHLRRRTARDQPRTVVHNLLQNLVKDFRIEPVVFHAAEDVDIVRFLHEFQRAVQAVGALIEVAFGRHQRCVAIDVQALHELDRLAQPRAGLGVAFIPMPVIDQKQDADRFSRQGFGPGRVRRDQGRFQ